MLLRAQVETERPGKVLVRAKAAPGKDGDGRPIGGFYVRRRYAGDEFRINDWQEFSPRWMEFVDEPPKDWIEKIEGREGMRMDLMAEAEVSNAKSPDQRFAEMLLSMSQVANGGGERGTINFATGKVTKESKSKNAEI